VYKGHIKNSHVHVWESLRTVVYMCVSMEKLMYICGLQWWQSSIYAGYNGGSHIQVHIGLYRGSFQQQVICKAVYQVLGMEKTPLRVEDRLDGAFDFLSWKSRVTLVLNEYDLWELLDKIVTPLIDLTNLEAYNKKEIKVERVLLVSVKDHLIPHLIEKNMSKEMFDSLVSLF
jgi:hypothetical protein